MLFAGSFNSCGSKEVEPSGYESAVPLNVDSLFINLNQKPIQEKEKIADAYFTKLNKKVGLNGVVLYAEQGQIIYEKAFGWKDLSTRREPLTIDDQFQLSSVSKMFTAEAIMLLHYRGQLNYDDNVKKYIPEFPYDNITIRNLLNHRSGLSRYESLADEHWTNKRVPLHNEELVKLLIKYKPSPYSRPDVTFHYNNINYALLCTVIERITGEHFEDFMRKHIFEPVGMKHSYIYSMRQDSILTPYMNCEVSGHDLRYRARKSQNDYLNGVMGDKIMFSTVEDLYRFSIALDYNLLLPDSIQKEAFVPGSPLTGRRKENYGFGWRLHKKHPTSVYHFGWWKGYRSFFIRELQKNRVLIVLTNTDHGIGGEALWRFVEDTTVLFPPASVNTDLLEYKEGVKYPFLHIK
jgi:Beta-lactamase class C and other penicillin binding proteins